MRFFIFFGISLLVFKGRIEAQVCEVSGSKCTLQGLSLNENQALSNISPNTWIKQVQLGSSILHSLPAQVFELFPNLESLELQDQKIKNINPNSFAKAERLIQLNLSGNEIKTLKANGFVGSKNLEYLLVSDNQLDTIEEGAFNGLTKLHRLDLNGNKLASIHENTFEPLGNLKIVQLHNNKISSLHANILKFNSKLEFFIFNDNQLHSLSPKTFEKLSHLSILHLKNNECVDKNWSAGAFPSMREIKESLKECGLNYVVDTTHSKFEEYLNRFGNLENQMLESKKALSILEVNQSTVNETLNLKLNEILDKFDANNAKFNKFEQTAEVVQANKAKFEEKLNKLDQKIENLASNLDLMRTQFEASLKANQNNEVLELLKMQDKNREVTMDNFNITLLKMQEKMEKLEMKTVDGIVHI